MSKLIFVMFAVMTISGSLAKSLRQKRQTSDSEDSLEDRYGWDRPRQNPSWFPNQNSLPGQFPNGGQGQFPWQNQNNGQGQFPWQNQNQNGGQGQFPWQNQNQQQRTTTPVPNGSTTLPSSVQSCITNCPATAEYNPVCGTDNLTYNNPGRLGCAQSCGVNVSLLRTSPCPTTTANPIS